MRWHTYLKKINCGTPLVKEDKRIIRISSRNILFDINCSCKWIKLETHSIKFVFFPSHEHVFILTESRGQRLLIGPHGPLDFPHRVHLSAAVRSVETHQRATHRFALFYKEEVRRGCARVRVCLCADREAGHPWATPPFQSSFPECL